MMKFIFKRYLAQLYNDFFNTFNVIFRLKSSKDFAKYFDYTKSSTYQ